MNMKLHTLSVLLFALSINSFLMAQWTKDLNLNLPICTLPNEQVDPRIISDSSGGAIILWLDYRNNNPDLYAQRVTMEGQKLWQGDGKPIITNRGDLSSHGIIGDGNGGAYIIWISSGHIYAQHIDSNGKLFYSDPIRVSSGTETQHSVCMTSDRHGGFIVAYISGPAYSWNNLVAQRVNSNGDLMWGESGKTIFSQNQSETPNIIATSNGGAYVLFINGWVNFDFYVQILDQYGNILLNGDGTHVGSRDYYHNEDPKVSLVENGYDGAIVVWESNREIFANRVNITGSKLWGENGIIVCEASTRKRLPKIIGDMKNGALIAWYDADPNSNHEDIYAQHIDSIGQKLWTSDGKPIVINNQGKGSQNYSIVSDNRGGIIAAWEGILNDSSDFVWVQHLNSSGDVLWPNGLKTSTNTSNKCTISAISDSNNGIIATWVDKRNGNSDIYAQRVDENTVTSIEDHILGEFPYTLTLSQNYPNPFNPTTSISFSLPSKSFVSLKVFDILGREVATLVYEEMPAGSYSRQWNATNMSSGIYFYRLQAGSFTETKKLILLR